jgi:glutathione S-transferase
MTTLFCETHWDSPFVFTAFVALTEKGISFETKPLDLGAGQQRAPDFQQHSLTGRVPTLEHDGFWLSESTAIVEYLDEVVPPPAPRLLPADARNRARARQVLGCVRIWQRSAASGPRAAYFSSRSARRSARPRAPMRKSSCASRTSSCTAGRRCSSPFASPMRIWLSR